MLNRSRTAMALLLAASVFALPTSVLAAQSADDDKAADKPTSNTSNTQSSKARAPRAANSARVWAPADFYIAGPSRFVTSGARRAAIGSPSRQQTFTESELREIRAAQQSLMRQTSPIAGQTRTLSTREVGGTVLSHPTLGHIIIGGSTPGGEQDPIGPITTILRQNPGLIFGPSPVAKPTTPTTPSDPTPGSGGTGSLTGSESGDPGSGGGSSGGSGGGDPVDFPILQPGRGFAGPTAQPPAVGNPHLRGYDAKAIARWDVVPYQDFDGLFHIGVVAFHMNGIDRVEFSVEGGPWTPVTEMKLNPRTDVWEYTATLDASLFDDGLVEVRARVFPRNAGEVRVLESLALHSNGSNTLAEAQLFVSARSGNDDTGDGSETNPLRSIAAAVDLAAARFGSIGGVTLLLDEGDYAAPSPSARTDDRWFHVKGKPGVDRSEVRIVSRGRPRTNLIRLNNLTVVPIERSTVFEGYTDDVQRLLWLDEVHVAGESRFDPVRSISNRYQLFVTDTLYTEVPDGPSGAALIRNVHLERLKSDAFQNASLVINTTVDTIDRGTTSAHPDVFQIFSPNNSVENRILYNVVAVRAKAQGIFCGVAPRGEEMRDIAFINTLIEVESGSGFKSQWNAPANHVLMWNVTLTGSFTWRTDQIRNFDIRHSVFDTMNVYGASADEIQQRVTGIYNHFVNSSVSAAITIGDEHTFGDPLFADRESSDYRPTTLSPLLLEGVVHLLPSDATGHVRRANASVGAVCYTGSAGIR